MRKQKMAYESPEISVTKVELESPICSGSVEFAGPDNKGITIKNQSYAEGSEANDFSKESWDIQTTTTEN